MPAVTPSGHYLQGVSLCILAESAFVYITRNNICVHSQRVALCAFAESASVCTGIDCIGVYLLSVYTGIECLCVY